MKTPNSLFVDDPHELALPALADANAHPLVASRVLDVALLRRIALLSNTRSCHCGGRASCAWHRHEDGTKDPNDQDRAQCATNANTHVSPVLIDVEVLLEFERYTTTAIVGTLMSIPRSAFGILTAVLPRGHRPHKPCHR